MWTSTVGQDFTLGNSWFGDVKLSRNTVDFDKYKHSGNGFDLVLDLIHAEVFSSSDGSGSNRKKDIQILGKGSTQGLDDTTLTVAAGCSINFSKQQKNLCLNLHYNEVNSYLYVKSIEIYKFKTKDSEINAGPLCLGNVSKVFLANMKKTGSC